MPTPLRSLWRRFFSPPAEFGFDALATACIQVGFGEDGIAITLDEERELYIVAVFVDQPYIETEVISVSQEALNSYGPEIAEHAAGQLIQGSVGDG